MSALIERNSFVYSAATQPLNPSSQVAAANENFSGKMSVTYRDSKYEDVDTYLGDTLHVHQSEDESEKRPPLPERPQNSA